MKPDPNRPLWKAIAIVHPPVDKIQDPLLDDLSRQIIAAELRTIANWLKHQTSSIGIAADPFFQGESLGRRMERDKIIGALLAEADRAEAGE